MKKRFRNRGSSSFEIPGANYPVGGVYPPKPEPTLPPPFPEVMRLRELFNQMRLPRRIAISSATFAEVEKGNEASFSPSFLQPRIYIEIDDDVPLGQYKVLDGQ